MKESFISASKLLTTQSLSSCLVVQNIHYGRTFEHFLISHTNVEDVSDKCQITHAMVAIVLLKIQLKRENTEMYT